MQFKPGDRVRLKPWSSVVMKGSRMPPQDWYIRDSKYTYTVANYAHPTRVIVAPIPEYPAAGGWFNPEWLELVEKGPPEISTQVQEVRRVRKIRFLPRNSS